MKLIYQDFDNTFQDLHNKEYFDALILLFQFLVKAIRDSKHYHVSINLKKNNF